MSTPFLGELRIFSFGYSPKGWALCNGQTLPINQNQALFSLLGTNYGGNGTSTFQLPNLQGRAPFSFSAQYVIGQSGGEESHTLTIPELPAHSHNVKASSNAADQSSPQNNYWAYASSNAYSATSDNTLASAAVSTLAGGQPHENRPPFLVLNICIALQGIFPSRN